MYLVSLPLVPICLEFFMSQRIKSIVTFQYNFDFHPRCNQSLGTKVIFMCNPSAYHDVYCFFYVTIINTLLLSGAIFVVLLRCTTETKSKICYYSNNRCSDNNSRA